MCCTCTPKNGGQAAQALGRSRGGFNTRIHVSVDALGNPIRYRLAAGQCHDVIQAEGLIADFEYEYVIARSYDADEFLQLIDATKAIPVIPPRSNRKQQRGYDSHLYRERHLFECLIGLIKHCRRIYPRFEKLASRHLGFLFFVGALIWLR